MKKFYMLLVIVLVLFSCTKKEMDSTKDCMLECTRDCVIECIVDPNKN